MRKRRKILIVVFISMVVGIMMLSTRVEAALQANGGTPLTANLNDWIKAVRNMQATGGTLGLTDTINTNLTTSNKNMDIHMEKNTEYGAMAILSASAYGNPNKITDGQTTTGNASGIQIKLNGEWVAAGRSDTTAGNMKGAAGRYWNNYGTGNGSNAKIGDAMSETNGWHGSIENEFFRHCCSHSTLGVQYNGPSSECGMERAYGGSVFGFFGLSYDVVGGFINGGPMCPLHVGAPNWNESAFCGGYVNKQHYGRACVVVGSGV